MIHKTTGNNNFLNFQLRRLFTATINNINNKISLTFFKKQSFFKHNFLKNSFTNHYFSSIKLVPTIIKN